jgi:hypothetical protein
MGMFSLSYAVFLIGSVILFQFCPAKLRPLIMVAISLLFYASQSAASAAVLVITTIMVFFAAGALERWHAPSRCTVLFASVAGVLLSYLLMIKLLPILHRHGVLLFTGSALALGVSYYTFKLLGYLIDVYWGKLSACNDPVKFLAFVSFYPQLPAGPIQRAGDFEFPCSSEKTAEWMRMGLRRILLGVVKKIVVADQLGAIVGYIDGVQPQLSNLLWIGACVYALEMYFDFAALTDIAIGSAGLFGIRSPENFAGPFFAPSISQFWRRWHMTLTNWLTDYVFTPLRMMTRNLGNLGLALSITVNMVLIGLWHGLGYGFLFFGLVHSAYLIVDGLTAGFRRKYYRRHPLSDQITNLVGPVFVFAMVAFALVFFRAESLQAIAYQMRHLFDGLRSPITSILTLWYGYGRMGCGLAGLATGTLFIWEFIQYSPFKWTARVPSFSALPVAIRWTVYYALTALAVILHQQSTHFIYVQF